MKTTTSLVLLCGAMALPAFAGTDYSPKTPVPMTPTCDWQWFLGGSAGYLLDQEEDMYHLQFGAEYVCPESCTHSVYLEVGYTDFDESGILEVPGTDQGLFDVDLEGEIIPLTLNYKFECQWTERVNWYVGAGIGAAFVDGKLSGGDGSASDDDTVLYGQIFAGLSYEVTPSFEVFGGARLILMDDPDFSEDTPLEDGFSLNEDVLLELGARYTF